MLRPLIRLLGVAFLAGLIIPPIAALMTKGRLARDGRGAFKPEANDLDTALIFDGGEYASTAPSFTGGELLTWYGGGRLDLRGATIAPDGADLRIRAVFGGVQLIVPTTWRVETDSTSFLGGVSDSTNAPDEPDAPVLRVSALAVLGGVAISNDRANRCSTPTSPRSSGAQRTPHAKPSTKPRPRSNRPPTRPSR